MVGVNRDLPIQHNLPTAPASIHNSPAPVHGSPDPVHGSPAPVHGSPAPVHGSPAPIHGSTAELLLLPPAAAAHLRRTRRSFLRWGRQGRETLCWCRSAAAPHCTALHCTALNHTALHCTALHCTTLHCTAPHCTALHCTTLHCTSPYVHCTSYSALHCSTLTASSEWAGSPVLWCVHGDGGGKSGYIANGYRHPPPIPALCRLDMSPDFVWSFFFVNIGHA